MDSCVYAVWFLSQTTNIVLREYHNHPKAHSYTTVTNYPFESFIFINVHWCWGVCGSLVLVDISQPRIAGPEFVICSLTWNEPDVRNSADLPLCDNFFFSQVSITGEWQSWQGKVPQIEVETHKVAAPDVVVPTLDTVRHEALLYTWLAEHKPLVLCGPPGSGKTMTLFSALRALPDMEVGATLVSWRHVNWHGLMMAIFFFNKWWLTV